MIRWEYKIVQNLGDRLGKPDEGYLNAFGEEGWELVSYHQTNLNQHLIFKRQLSEDREQRDLIYRGSDVRGNELTGDVDPNNDGC